MTSRKPHVNLSAWSVMFSEMVQYMLKQVDSVSELEELKQLSNLTYIGTLNIEKELHNYDISIIMSSYEGFSRILLESLYVGLFCISNNIPGTSWQKEFKNSVLINNNNVHGFINEIKSQLLLAFFISDLLKEA